MRNVSQVDRLVDGLLRVAALSDVLGVFITSVKNREEHSRNEMVLVTVYLRISKDRRELDQLTVDEAKSKGVGFRLAVQTFDRLPRDVCEQTEDSTNVRLNDRKRCSLTVTELVECLCSESVLRASKQ